MERKYVAVNAVGKPLVIFDQIRQIVQQLGLTRTIPAVKFEKKAKRQFYVFLAVEGTVEPQLPDNVENVLQHVNLNLRGKPLWPIDPSEIVAMTGGSELVIHGFNLLPYSPELPNHGDDPFDLSAAFSNAETVSDPSLGDRYNLLLHWLSATAEGTWQTFRNVCSVLQLVDDRNSERSIFRRLTLLGHIESSENGQNWSICPTALVQCPTDQDVYILTGQQTPMLIEHLREHYEIELLPQPNYQGPSCVRVNGFSTNDVSLNGFNIVQVGTVSLQLAHLLPDLEGWKDVLPAINKLSTTTYNIEIWNGRKYMQCDNFYESEGRYYGESGLYRLTKKEENNPYQIVLYFDEPNQRWLRGDWYGLRFLTYNRTGRHFEVKYESSANKLIIPNEEHWALLYERALVLASGMLPVRDKTYKWLKYTNISKELVQLFTEKLNIIITEV